MKHRTLALPSLIAVVSVAGMGCSGSLPRYKWRDATTAIQTMTRRDGAIRTFSATARLWLDAEAGRVALTAAIVAQAPHRLRLRAWKFSQAVFDFTLNEDGLFVLDKRRPSRSRGVMQPITYARFAEAMSLMPGFERDSAWHALPVTNNRTFTIVSRLNGQDAAIECVVDKRTLTKQRCLYRDDRGRIRQSLNFSRYTRVGDIVWPLRVLGAGERGSFELAFDRVEVNIELAPRAFDPPRRAVKQP